MTFHVYRRCLTVIFCFSSSIKQLKFWVRSEMPPDSLRSKCYFVISCYFVPLVFNALCVGRINAEFYVLDDQLGLGRRYDGIGGLSGGGVRFSWHHPIS